MNRKSFLTAVIPLASLTTGFTKTSINKEAEKIIPPYLKKGDCIGITCPSGHITLEECLPAMNKIKEWGYNFQIGATVGATDFTFAGNDEARAKDLQQMLDDDSIKAILLGRGGYGAVRIIDKINFNHFQKKPKWVIGFSDATVLHAHINHNYGIATIHSKMCNSFPEDFLTAEQTQIDSIDSIRKCLSGEYMKYQCMSNENNRLGECTGSLVGGNLSIIENLCGTDSDLHTAGKILFLEDVGEYPYKIDSMMWNLKRTKKLDRLKGLIIGQFRMKPDDPGEEFGKNIYEIIAEKVNEFHYPLCFNFPVGHVKENYSLKCGMKHQLVVSSTATILTCPG